MPNQILKQTECLHHVILLMAPVRRSHCHLHLQLLVFHEVHPATIRHNPINV